MTDDRTNKCCQVFNLIYCLFVCLFVCLFACLLVFVYTGNKGHAPVPLGDF